jgi:hypothetical protein
MLVAQQGRAAIFLAAKLAFQRSRPDAQTMSEIWQVSRPGARNDGQWAVVQRRPLRPIAICPDEATAQEIVGLHDEIERLRVQLDESGRRQLENLARARQVEAEIRHLTEIAQAAFDAAVADPLGVLPFDHLWNLGRALGDERALLDDGVED